MTAPNNVFQSIRDSLYAVCKKFSTDMATAYPSYGPITIYNFDAFSEQNALPAGDLVGVSGYTLDVDTELATFSCKIGLATENDENLFRLDQYAGLMFKRLLPDQTITIYDSETASICGQAKLMNGTSVSPVYRAIQRPLKFIAISGGLGLAIQP